MAVNTQKTTWTWAALGGLLLVMGLLSIPSWNRWRDFNVYRALQASQSPSFWWPPGWRRELRTSFLLEGQVFLRDREPKQVGGEPSAPVEQSRLGRPATAGTIELVSETQGQVFRTTATNGRYSFNPQRLPIGPFKVRLLTAEGSTTRWLQMGALDQGLHRINWSF
jgi:hypothetical protein